MVYKKPRRVCRPQPASLLSENSEGIFDRVSASGIDPGAFLYGKTLFYPLKMCYTSFIIEAKYPVITGFLSQSVGIMQK